MCHTMVCRFTLYVECVHCALCCSSDIKIIKHYRMDSALPQHSFGTRELSLFESIFESLLMDGFSATVYIYIYTVYTGWMVWEVRPHSKAKHWTSCYSCGMKLVQNTKRVFSSKILDIFVVFTCLPMSSHVFTSLRNGAIWAAWARKTSLSRLCQVGLPRCWSRRADWWRALENTNVWVEQERQKA